MHRAAPLVVAALALTACAGSSGTGGSGSGPELSGAWELTGGAAGGVALPRPAGSSATLDIDAGELRGVAFCNHYSAPYRLDGTSVAVDALGSTEMACEPELMAAERLYLSALAEVDAVTADGEELLLTGPGVELRFSPAAPVPTSALVGTRWVLESLLAGELASSTAGQPATLALAADGTVTGSTGCRVLTGTWESRGSTVVLPDLTAEGDCPEELRAQDDHVVAVLGDGFHADVDADRLTLTDPDGRGLVYRAEG